MQCHLLPKKQKSPLYFVRPTPYITSCIGLSLGFFMRLWSKDSYSHNIKVSLQLFIVSINCTISSSPGPREIPGCTGRCQVTYCHACYFSKQPRQLPGKCSLCGAPVTNLKCLKQWTFCIHLADKLRHGWVSPATC